jgi:predicted GNAT family acetyltransferase
LETGTVASTSAWRISTDLHAFLHRAEAFLHSRPVPHTVLLTTIHSLRGRKLPTSGPDAPLFGTLDRAGQVGAVFINTPRQGVMVTPMSPSEVAALAARFEHDEVGPRGMSGERASVEAFTSVWEQRTGAVVTRRRRERLYSLDTLTPRDPAPPGRARPAERSDRELLARWAQEYAAAIGETGDRDFGAWADTRLAYGGVTLWENPEGEPVAMAGSSRRVAHQIRIAPVYTPAHLRGRGYAGAVTSAVTRSALSAGADDVLLFTDLDNPTSNALYQRLGYRPVADFESVGLSAVH